MPRESDIKPKLLLLFDDLKENEKIKVAIDNIFSRYEFLLDSFKDFFNQKYEQDVKYALAVNRQYYDTVQFETKKYRDILENNHASLKEAIKSNDDKLIKIQNNSDEIKIESQIIIDNREIDVKKEIIIANRRLNKLIQASNKEIEGVKKKYLENSDKLLNDRDIELEVLASEYQIKLEHLRQQTRDRNQIYEQQISKNRQIREQYVLAHSDKYKEIKNLHTSFSIYYNSKIDEISQKYRNEVKKLNESYSEKINALTEKVSGIEKNILAKELETKDLIQEKSEMLKTPFQEAKDAYDNDLRQILQKQNEELQELEDDFKAKEQGLLNKIKTHQENYDASKKTKEDRTLLNTLVKPVRKSLFNERKAYVLQVKSVKDDYKVITKNLYEQFNLKKLNLDLEFVSFEYTALLENGKYFEESLLQINLLNLDIEKLEEEKNQKIWLLNNAYNYDINYIERILALGSERQEFMIQDQVGNNSYALAASQYNNELVKTSFEIDSENSNLEIKILKIAYLNNVKMVTSKYQLLIQAEMVKRDTLIKQYEYEIEIERENLKHVELSSNLDHDLLKLKAENELELELMANDQKAKKLNYFLNLTKIKLDNVNKKHEATLEYEIAEAKAKRNMIMYRQESEKADRYYLGLIETLIKHHTKIDEIVDIIEISYLHPEFSMIKFYQLVDYMNEVIPIIKDESKLILSYFAELTDYEILRKLDELTGFHYQNRLQSIMDQNDSSEEIIRQDIDQLTEDRRVLNNELISLDRSTHRDNIQISQLYRDIQVLKTEKHDLESSDELIRLKAEVERLNNQVRQSEKLKKQIEKQIAYKDNKILHHNNRLNRLKKIYNMKKKKLNNRVKKEGRVYYQERENNLRSFEELRKNIENYVNCIIRNLNRLKLNLTKTGEAIEIFSNKHQALRLDFKNMLFKKLNDFRKVNIRMYFNQEKDQENISNSFNSSYHILVNNLNQNYRNNFIKEKRKRNETRRAHELSISKLQHQYNLNVEKTNQKFQSRANIIQNQLQMYDNEFSNTFIYRREYIKTIDVNKTELEKGLEQNTLDLTNSYTKEFDAFYLKKKSLLKDLSTKHYRLFNSTIARSIKYRDNYLETKDNIIDDLKTYHKDNQELIKTQETAYRKYLRKKKQQEKLEHQTFKDQLDSKNNKINQRFLKNLRQIRAQR